MTDWTEAVAKQVRLYMRLRLAKIQQERGLQHGSSAALARELGVTPASVSQWLTGGPKSASPELEHKVATALGLTVDEFRKKAVALSLDLPAEFQAALTLLKVRHGRDFEEAALQVLGDAAHRPEGLSIEMIAERIYQRASSKAAATSERALDDEETERKKTR